MTERRPPLAQELHAIPADPGWRAATPGAVSDAPGPEAPEALELERLREQVLRLTSALEDIVTFALSSADYKERAITMHRRAVAALTHPTTPPRASRSG